MKTVRYIGPAAPPITISVPSVDGQWVTDDNGVVQVPAGVADRLTGQDIWRAGGTKPATIDQVLADVDGDPAKAAVALDAEQAADKPRARLVAALTEIVTAVTATDEPASPDASDTDTSEED